MADTRSERILALLRASGGRVTTARRSVVSALVDATGHVTADDLAERVQSSHPDVHRSTIYRTLEALEAMGVVAHVHLGHGRAVYHLADEAHQHLVCDACGAVVEVPASTFASLERKLRQDHGFTLRADHFALTGRCAGCA